MSELVVLAGHLEALGNFSGLMALLTALQQGCVSRLALTLALVPKADKEKLLKLQVLMSGSKNYGNYREQLSIRATRIYATEGLDENVWKGRHGASAADAASSSSPPIPTGPLPSAALVPHLGAHLAELASIGEGNPEQLSEAPHLSNLGRCRQVARSVSQLTKLQRITYEFRPVRLLCAAISLALGSHTHLTAASASDASRALFALSLSQEPPARPVATAEEACEGQGGEGDGEEEEDEEEDDEEDEDDEEEEEEEEEVVVKVTRPQTFLRSASAFLNLG